MDWRKGGFYFTLPYPQVQAFVFLHADFGVDISASGPLNLKSTDPEHHPINPVHMVSVPFISWFGIGTPPAEGRRLESLQITLLEDVYLVHAIVVEGHVSQVDQP